MPVPAAAIPLPIESKFFRRSGSASKLGAAPSSEDRPAAPDRMKTSPTPIPFLDLPRQHAAIKQELMAVFSKALDSASFIGGPMVSGFEQAFARYVGAAHCVGMGSGTDALRLALLAMGIGPGDHVVTVPNTFIATTEAVSQTGATFEFVDIDPETCLMDANRLEDLLRLRSAGSGGPRPTVALPVHLYGQTAEMQTLMDLAQRYGLKVLEDAAQAHGALHHGRPAGGLGHAAAFSFYAGKNLGACGEGGAVTTSDAALAERMSMLRDHGQSQKYRHQFEGYNARLDAIQAGILQVKLAHLDRWNEGRRRVAARYDAAFAELPWVRPVRVLPHNRSCYHLYVVHVPDRDGLREHLDREGIGTGLHYPIPLHLQPAYAAKGWGRGSFPHAERSAESLLSLPMFPEMTDAQVERVVRSIQHFGEPA